MTATLYAFPDPRDPAGSIRATEQATDRTAIIRGRVVVLVPRDHHHPSPPPFAGGIHAFAATASAYLTMMDKALAAADSDHHPQGTIP